MPTQWNNIPINGSGICFCGMESNVITLTAHERSACQTTSKKLPPNISIQHQHAPSICPRNILSSSMANSNSPHSMKKKFHVKEIMGILLYQACAVVVPLSPQSVPLPHTKQKGPQQYYKITINCLTMSPSISMLPFTFLASNMILAIHTNTS